MSNDSRSIVGALYDVIFILFGVTSLMFIAIGVTALLGADQMKAFVSYFGFSLGGVLFTFQSALIWLMIITVIPRLLVEGVPGPDSISEDYKR